MIPTKKLLVLKHKSLIYYSKKDKNKWQILKLTLLTMYQQ